MKLTNVSVYATIFKAIKLPKIVVRTETIKFHIKNTSPEYYVLIYIYIYIYIYTYIYMCVCVCVSVCVSMCECTKRF